MQEFIGGNWLFLVFGPYFAATGLQDTHLKIGLIAGCGGAGGVLLLGLVANLLKLRKVWPYYLELVMLVMYGTLLGLAYGKDTFATTIQQYYNFIVHGTLAAACLASLLVCRPASSQHARELLHRLPASAQAPPRLRRAGLIATALLTLSLASSCLLYLVPFLMGVTEDHWNPYNLTFRLAYPPAATFLALLLVRMLFLPSFVPEMKEKPPMVLDGTMYQAAVDAAAKVREGTTMPRAPPKQLIEQLRADIWAAAQARMAAGGGMSAHEVEAQAQTEAWHEAHDNPLYRYAAPGPPMPTAVYGVYDDDPPPYEVVYDIDLEEFLVVPPPGSPSPKARKPRLDHLAFAGRRVADSQGHWGDFEPAPAPPGGAGAAGGGAHGLGAGVAAAAELPFDLQEALRDPATPVGLPPVHLPAYNDMYGPNELPVGLAVGNTWARPEPVPSWPA
ncbi:hypothetical protein HYH03_012866 [Edaphochlamys debaryana]|uniref:Uncharacterized protein n=1 Tax=Edaphochlamys debaryana TaxID=47281 RepID=A0A836BTY3_9CHLO|nr:hypothetical protein HYH03_012866 [Edaphochlamys debaryana]|eukprot:KAG2488547.1 hypothetical protein HYH03_012866 [Edaphochlamys debaryana]